MIKDPSPPKPWLDTIIDSIIIAFIALFSTPGSLDSLDYWLVGSKAFGLALVMQLVIERGIKWVGSRDG